MIFLRRLYNKICLRLYSTGKKEHARCREQLMHRKAKTGQMTKFHPEAEIINFSNHVENIQVGYNCHISGLLLVYSYGGLIKIGNNCSVSENSRIISAKKIDIGNRVLIGHNVNILDNISHPIDADLRHEDYVNSYSVGMKQYDIKAEEIIIEDDVWIGFNSIIMRGVTIGKGAIIGAGSVVVKDVKPWTVNVGNPLRCIRELDPVEVKEREL